MNLHKISCREEFIQFVLANPPRIHSDPILCTAFDQGTTVRDVDVWIHNNIGWLSAFIVGFKCKNQSLIEFELGHWRWCASNGEVHYDAIYQLYMERSSE